jgi:hypothetical protein
VVFASIVSAQLTLAAGAAAQQALVTLAPSAAAEPMTGRLFVIFARTADREPRFLAGNYTGSVPFYGMDVTAWKPGATTRVGASVQGFPFDHLTQMPAGDYYVQALLMCIRSFTGRMVMPSGSTPISGRGSTGRYRQETS